jgi:hypothetical protein
VPKDVVSSNFYIEVVSLFPCFLDKPGSYIVLMHFVDQIFQLGCVRGGVNQYISLWVPWVMPRPCTFWLYIFICLSSFVLVLESWGCGGLRSVLLLVMVVASRSELPLGNRMVVGVAVMLTLLTYSWGRVLGDMKADTKESLSANSWSKSSVLWGEKNWCVDGVRHVFGVIFIETTWWCCQ